MKRLAFYSVAALSIFLLVNMLIPAIRSDGHPSRKSKCEFEMQQISSALQQYQSETGEYPPGQTTNILTQLRATNTQGKPFLLYPSRAEFGKREFVDPWGTQFQIEIMQRSNFVVRSAGRNGKLGDSDDLAIFSRSNNWTNP